MEEKSNWRLVVQSLSRVWLFATPWTAACQPSLSFTVTWSLLKSCPLSQGCYPAISSSVTPFFSCPQSFPASGSFLMSHLFISDGQSIGASASPSVLPMNIQDWFILGLTGLISLLFKRLSTIFSSTTIWKHQFFGTQPSLWFNSHICTWLQEKPQLCYTDFCWVMSLLFNMLSRFVIAFLPRSKRLLISWLQSPTTMIL